ncbi:hypothetical protein QJS10_CPB15g01017 [Acorus calamus]|uniref:Uncharacterized protein n=1 Tax=Acorus calamus TaxID=4465 RepID=A0AAV9D7S9_ACOCL|nr:hypothetical protein QJS10_CPB15g01017 [Acorus calamus]
MERGKKIIDLTRRGSSKRKSTPRSALPLATGVKDGRQKFWRVYQPRSAFPLVTVLKCGRPKARRAKLAGPSGDHTSIPSPEGMPTWIGTLAGTSGDHHSPPLPEIMPTSGWVSVYCYRFIISTHHNMSFYHNF